MNKILVLFVLLINLLHHRHFNGGVFASMSGFYIDNGYDKTVLHQELSLEDQMEVEHEILDLLGLPDRPKKKHIHPSLRKSAPRFLMDIYQKLEDENNLHVRRLRSTDAEDNFLTEEDERAIDQSDIIMTFLTKNHHVPEVRHERGRRLWFDISEISLDTHLMMAELRMYKNVPKVKKRNQTIKYQISVFTISEFGGEEDLVLQTSINTTSDYQGWIEVNVTSTLDKWILHKDKNRGFYISITNLENPDHDVRFDEIGLISSRGDEEHQPFMVAFFKGQQMIQTHKRQHTRVKRNAQRKRGGGGNKQGRSELRNPLMHGENHRSCQIQTLYVSFKDLKWQDWIVAPDGYGAFYCSGECNFPLNAHMNATNHAIVQTLVHLMNPGRVPKPCCAPTRLSAISVLYYLDDSNVNLKKYKNMVVKSCGCH